MCPREEMFLFWVECLKTLPLISSKLFISSRGRGGHKQDIHDFECISDSFLFFKIIIFIIYNCFPTIYISVEIVFN